MAYPSGGGRVDIAGLVVAVGAGQTGGVMDAITSLRIGLAERLVQQPKPIHAHGALVVDQYAGPLDQVTQDVMAGGCRQIQGDALFVGIQVKKRPATFWMRGVLKERPPPAGGLPGAGRFNFMTSAPRSANNFPQYGADRNSSASPPADLPAGRRSRRYSPSPAIQAGASPGVVP